MTEGPGYWQRLQQQRLLRRQVLNGATVAGLGLAAMAAFGCGREERPRAAPEGAPQPRRGGILARHGGPGTSQDADGRPFDPHTQPGTLVMTLRLVYQGLLGYHLATYETEPDLAQTWEQPSATEYLFRLAPSAKWQNKPPANGREVTAQDVVFSLNRARTDNPIFLGRSLVASLDRIEAVDRATVKITTKVPDASTLAGLSSDGPLIMNPEVVEKTDRFINPDDIVGSGAFIVRDITQNVGAEYIRHPGYFKPELPYLDAVRTPYFSDPQAAYAAFLAGRIDIVGRVPGTQVKDYIARQGPGFTPQWYETDAIYVLGPHTGKRPFTDPRVNRALRLLADHQEFIKSWAETQSGEGRYGSIFPAAMKAWDVPQEEYQRSIFWQQPKERAIREALDLLNAAGFTRDNPLRFQLATLDSPTIKTAAELLYAQFRQNSQGLLQVTEIALYDFPTQNRVQAQGTFEYGFWPLTVPVVDPGLALSQFWRSGASRNLWRFSDSKLDEMIDRQNVTFDTRERRAQVQTIVRYMMDNSPAVTAANPLNLNAVAPKVHGFIPENFLNGRQYQWIWLAT